MKKLTWGLYGLTVLMLLSCGRKKEMQITELTGIYEEAFKARNATQMDSLFAMDFAISVYEYPKTGIMVESILKQYLALDSLKVRHIDTLDTGYRVDLEYFFHDRDVFSSGITLNDSLQIVYVDLFDNLYRVNREARSEMVAEIPFFMENGNIAVEVRLNDCKDTLKMMFDTGSDGMAITSATAKKVTPLNVRDHSAAVVGQQADTKFSSGNTLHIGDLEIPNQNLAIFPAIHGDFDGIFGGNLYNRYITKVDFDTQHIVLYSLGKFTQEEEWLELDADFSSGIPVVDIDLVSSGRSVTGEFAFDTGAGYNIICYGPLVAEEALLDDFSATYFSTNISMGYSRQISMGRFENVCVADYCFEQVPAAIQEYEEKDSTWATHDGSLGIDLISRFNFIADRLNKRIYLEPNSHYDTAFEFELNGLILEFDHQREMIIKNVLSRDLAANTALQSGMRVLFINDQDASEFLEPNKIAHLKTLSQNQSVELIVETDERETIKITI